MPHNCVDYVIFCYWYKDFVIYEIIVLLIAFSLWSVVCILVSLWPVIELFFLRCYICFSFVVNNLYFMLFVIYSLLYSLLSLIWPFTLTDFKFLFHCLYDLWFLYLFSFDLGQDPLLSNTKANNKLLLSKKVLMFHYCNQAWVAFRKYKIESSPRSLKVAICLRHCYFKMFASTGPQRV